MTRAPFISLLVLAACSATPGPLDAGSACPAPTGSGTSHSGDLTADETWSATGSPHVIASDMRVFATVTLEPCAQVLLGERARVTVGSATQNGKIIARGATTTPVTFGAQDASKPWGSLSIDIKGSLDFTDTTLRDGANPAAAQNGGGVVVAYGTASNTDVLTRSLRFVNVTIVNARGHGVNLQRMSGFTADSSNLVVTDSGGAASPYPVLVEAGAVGTLPALKFTNTLSPDVFVEPRGSMPNDTFRARGAPYRIGGRLLVAPSVDGSTSTLTIEAGVTLKMGVTSDSGLTVGTSATRQGVLVVNGTASAPVLFTSGKATPAAGDWTNVYFRNTPNTGNRFEGAIVEFAGAPSGLQGYGCGPVDNDASVIVSPDSGRPQTAFIQNTTVRSGAGDTGLLLGWRSDVDGPDFLPTNTFTNVPLCKVSRWRNITGNECPGSTAGSPVCLL